MKRLFYSILFLMFAVIANAQTIRYDTIRVSKDDARNINRTTSTQGTVGQAVATSKPTTRMQNSTSTFNFDQSKLRYGANLGLSLSRNYTYLNIGPQVGYQLNNQFMMGVGVKYNYNKVRGYQYNNSSVYKNNLLGVNAFGYLYPISFITIYAQPEINYLWSHFTNETTGESLHTNGAVPSFLVGAGLRLGRSHLTLNYDLVQHTNSPYSSGVFLGVSVFL